MHNIPSYSEHIVHPVDGPHKPPHEGVVSFGQLFQNENDEGLLDICCHTNCDEDDDDEDIADDVAVIEEDNEDDREGGSGGSGCDNCGCAYIDEVAAILAECRYDVDDEDLVVNDFSLLLRAPDTAPGVSTHITLLE